MKRDLPPADSAVQAGTELGHELERLARAVPTTVDGFLKSASTESIAALCDHRHALIRLLLTVPATALADLWAIGLAPPYLLVLNSGLRDLPRQASEQALFDALLPLLQGAGFAASQPGALAALMLLGQNFELPLLDDIEALPDWLRPHHLGFVFESVDAHHGIGDAERCVDHLCRLTDLVHGLAVSRTRPASEAFRAEMLSLYLGRLSLVQAYFSPRNLAPMYRQRGQLFSAGLLAQGVPTLHAVAARPAAARRVRLGIFAQHFGPQTETFFTLSHFEHLDRSRFEITLYAVSSSTHPLEAVCRAHADRFVTLPAGLAAQLRCIRDDRLDILLISTNMSVMANTASLLGACRAAPLQIATVSTPVTTGAAHVDVMLSCEWNEPQPDAEAHFTETLYRMPGSVNYYAYQHDADVASIVPTRQQLGIDEKTLVMFSGANFYKIVPEQSLTWVRILAAVPDSVLLLMPFNPNWSASYKRLPFVMRVQRQLKDHGLDASRLRIIDPVPTRADVHCIVALADLYLDPYPFSGACSLLDPIIVGVPPVVRSGSVGRSNHGASLMRMLGLDELVCATEGAYAELAIRMAQDPAERTRVRDQLLAHGSAQPPTYLDTARFSSRVGNALLDLHGELQARLARFAALPAERRRATLQSMADKAVAASAALRQIGDIGLVTQLIEPYFASLPEDGPRHVVDVGACYGAMSAPLLERGWTADLFEPDPAANAVLARHVGSWAPRARLHAMAVSDSGSDTVSFHQAAMHGLSGLGNSPFAPTQATLTVPCTALRDFYPRQGVTRVDLLKIDAEGYDFDVLETHDFAALPPRLVLVEYGTHFPRQTTAVVNAAVARMVARGYAAVIFDCRQDGAFERGEWLYHVTRVIIDAPLPAADEPAFGNIVFHRHDDTAFVAALHALFDSCVPATERVMAALRQPLCRRAARRLAVLSGVRWRSAVQSGEIVVDHLPDQLVE